MAQTPPPETLDISFPLAGIDTSDEFGAQRPNTTPTAINVRSLDPFQERERGGSRHGLAKFPNQQIPTDALHSILTIVQDASDAFVTTAAPHGLVGTEIIRITGTSNSAYNGVQTVSVGDATSFFISGYLGDSTGGSWSMPGDLLVQHLNQIVIQSGEFLLTTFTDFQDSIPVTGYENPNSEMPPEGNGFQPNRNYPTEPRRRVEAVPSAVTMINEQTLTITATLSRQSAGTFVGSETVVLTTNPPGMDGDGEEATTDVNGEAVFSVTEPTYEGQIQYTVYNEYDTP